MLGTFSALSASLHLCVRLSTEDFRLTVSPLILIYIPELSASYTAKNIQDEKS